MDETKAIIFLQFTTDAPKYGIRLWNNACDEINSADFLMSTWYTIVQGH
jgi:hypothetical protein